jgi:cyclophilin family peptidyl-prolyl cis-trans isomerase
MVLLKDLPFWPKNYVIFGKVTRGFDVAKSIGNVELVPVLGPDDGRPKTDVMINSVDIKTRPSPKLMQISDPGK